MIQCFFSLGEKSTRRGRKKGCGFDTCEGKKEKKVWLWEGERQLLKPSPRERVFDGATRKGREKTERHVGGGRGGVCNLVESRG